jgi:hypothetical protein
MGRPRKSSLTPDVTEGKETNGSSQKVASAVPLKSVSKSTAKAVGGETLPVVPSKTTVVPSKTRGRKRAKFPSPSLDKTPEKALQNSADAEWVSPMTDEDMASSMASSSGTHCDETGFTEVKEEREAPGGIPLPKSNKGLDSFMDSATLFSILTSVDQTIEESVPEGVKSDVYFLVDNKKNVDRRSKGLASRFMDDSGPWNGPQSTSNVTTFLRTPDGKFTRVLKKGDNYWLYYKSVRLNPQPEPETLIRLHRNYNKHMVDPTYERRITWLSSDGEDLQPVACYEYKGLYPGRGLSSQHATPKMGRPKKSAVRPGAIVKMEYKGSSQKAASAAQAKSFTAISKSTAKTVGRETFPVAPSKTRGRKRARSPPPSLDKTPGKALRKLADAELVGQRKSTRTRGLPLVICWLMLIAALIKFCYHVLLFDFKAGDCYHAHLGYSYRQITTFFCLMVSLWIYGLSPLGPGSAKSYVHISITLVGLGVRIYICLGVRIYIC